MRRGGLIIAMLLAAGTARAQRTGTNPAEGDTERCRRLVEDGEYQKAEGACAQALRIDAGYVNAWRLYLPTLIALHKEDKAIAEAERAETTLGINDPAVLANHGAAILSAAGRPAVDPKTQTPNKWAKQFARALPYLERAAALDADQAVAQPLLCTYWTLERQYMDRSAAACQSALRKQPNNPDLLSSQGWIYLNHRRWADAQTTADQVLRTLPKNEQLGAKKAQTEMKAKILLGLAQAYRGDCSGARRTLEPIQKFAVRGGALIDRGLTMCAQTQQEADRYGNEYMRLMPNDPEGPLARAIAYRNISAKKRGGDASLLGGALSDSARAKQLASGNDFYRHTAREATQNRAEILSQLGRYTEAEDEWKPIYELEGASNADAVLGYGTASRKAGHLKVAQKVFEQGVKKNPDNAPIKFELGRTLVEAGELTGGIKDMESALSAEEGKDLARKNELVNVLTREGVNLATKGGKPKEAETLLEKAVKYDPNSVLANRDLGLVRLQQRKYAEAIGPLQVWQRKQGVRDSNLILGRALAGLGKRDEAIKAYEVARDAAQRANSTLQLPMAEVLLELSPLYLAAGRTDDAVKAIETARDNVQATANLPANAANAPAIRLAKNLEPVIRRNRALAYLMRGYDNVQKKGNADAGVADLQRALEGGLEGKEKANATCALALGLLGANKAGQAVQSFQQAQKLGGCDFKAPYDKLGLDYWIAYARYREGTPAGLNDALKVFAKTQAKASGEMAERFKEMTFTAYLKLMAEEYARGNTAGSMAALKNAQKAATQVKDDLRKRDLQHNLAVLDLASGKTAQAKQQLEQLGARPPEALVNLGLIYERQGDISKALQLWQQSGRGGKVREWIDATRRFLGVGGGGAGGGQP